jgi:hypothetical protein
MTDAAQPDLVMRWLIVALCLPMFAVGGFGLLMPRQYRDALLGLSGRIPDQRSIAPFVRFMNARHFVLLVRVFSLFPISMAIALLFRLR